MGNRYNVNMKHGCENTKVLVVIGALIASFLSCIGWLIAYDHIASSAISVIFGIIALCVVACPVMGFGLFVTALPFDTMTVLPEHFVNMTIRPYQMIGFLLGAALLWSIVRKKVSITDVQGTIIDALVVGFCGMGIITVQYALDSQRGLFGVIVVVSFGLLYLVTRFFVHSYDRVMLFLPVIVVSGWIMSVYAIVQNVVYLHGGQHGEFMPGRPNAFFSEPDWLGMYLVFVFSVCVSYLYYNAHHKHVWRFFDLTLWSITSTIVVGIILTMARSAWLGGAVVIMTYLLCIFWLRRYKMFARHVLWIGSVLAVSVGTAYYAPITNFDLINRAQSTTTGLQEITVSCADETQAERVYAREKITATEDLISYDCRHIDLEEIGHEKNIGRSVTTVKRDDPNIVVRARTYDRVMQLIRERPLSGYGWGSSGTLLGYDEHGTPLNASNILLETALSIGVIGVGVLILIFMIIGVRALTVLRGAHDELTRSVAFFGLLGLVAIAVPNLFNAGLFLGFVWVYMGMVALLCKRV